MYIFLLGTNVCLYIIMVCIDCMTIFMHPCVVLTAINAIYYWLTVYCPWCASMQILYNYSYICVTVQCTILSLHPPSYNIVRYGFCLTVLCLFDFPVSLIVYMCHWSVTVFTIIYFPSHCTTTTMYWQFILGDNRIWDVLM